MVILQKATIQQLTALINADKPCDINEFDIPQDGEIAPRFLLELAINQLSQDPMNSFWWSPRLIVVDGQIVGMSSFKSIPTIVKWQTLVVFHIAGFLSIWGQYEEFYETNVLGTECTLAAAQVANVPCFVQIGAAASVFDHQPLSQIDESHPLKQPKFSPYIATKSIAEQRVIAANRPGFRTSVVRPSWIWGKGDHVLPQLVTAVKTGQFIWIAQGNYPYMTTHVTNVCHGAILAAERSSGGQAYFLSDGDVVQFRKWVTALLQIAGVKPGRLSIPRWVAWNIAGLIEMTWRITRRKDVPPITRTMVRLIGQELTFTDRKAREELGYIPLVDRELGLAELANLYR